MGNPVLVKPEFTDNENDNQDSDKTEPRHPDDEGGDEVDADRDHMDDSKPICTWSKDPDEHRRVFIFDKLADSDIAGNTLVENMEVVCKWLKDGTTPHRNERKLKSVKE